MGAVGSKETVSVATVKSVFDEKLAELAIDGEIPASALCQSLQDAVGGVEGAALVSSREVMNRLAKYGLVRGDPRMRHVVELCEEKGFLTEEEFRHLKDSSLVISRAMSGGLVVPDFEGLCQEFTQLYNEVLPNREGANADYIPQLSERYVNPELFGVSLCTIDGQRFNIGDTGVRFGIQSCSKAISYCIAQMLHGPDVVHRHVGMEPSGRPFNEICLDERAHQADLAKRKAMSPEAAAAFVPRPAIPHNPMINAGAIMTASLLYRDQPVADRFDSIMAVWNDLVGCDATSPPGDRPSFANSMYLSESATADRNFCLGYMMQEEGAFMPGTNLVEILNLYFMCCSIELSAQMMASVAATLANGGVNPVTGKRVFTQAVVKNTLSLMASCGMYDFSGEFAFTMGFPAKSGVGGAILVVIPGVMGICTFSPRLDPIGNSARGVAFCHKLAGRFAFHNYASLTEGSLKNPARSPHAQTPDDALRALLWAVTEQNRLRVTHLLLHGVDVNSADYDGRTPLHLAACGGDVGLIKFLVANGADPVAVDRFGNTPAMDAAREQHGEAAALLGELKGKASLEGKSKRLLAVGSSDGKTVELETVLQLIEAVGIPRADVRIATAFKGAPQHLDAAAFDAIFDSVEFVSRTLVGGLVLEDFANLREKIGKIHAAVQSNTDGENADYIPILAKQDPNKWGVAVCSVDGQRMHFGDCKDEFCVQSSSKAITYCIAVEENGAETVRKHIGREPSGRPFNEIVMDRRVSPAVPHNPCINAGAIMSCALVQQQLGDDEDRVQYCLSKYWSRLSGKGHAARGQWYDRQTYKSESATANRNRCLAYMMAEAGTFPQDIKTPAELMQNLEFYFKCCSIMQDADSMSIIAGTLANGGVCPVTDERIFKESTVRDCLSLVYSCGMYDYSGEFAFKIGFPSKSGVAGALLVVIPNRMGICTWSPPLDMNGNSVRGIDFCNRLSDQFNFHVYDRLPSDNQKYDPTFHSGTDTERTLGMVIEAASKNDLHAVKLLHTMHGAVLVNSGDYDSRTALHLACAEGHVDIVKYIAAHPELDLQPVDRWGSSPVDDAKRGKHDDVVAFLEAAIAQRKNAEN